MDRDIRRPSWRRRSGGDGAAPAEGSRRVLTRQSTVHRSRSRSPRAGTPSSARKSRRRPLPPLPVGAPPSQSAAAAAAAAVTGPPLVEASGHPLARWADQGASSALRMLALADQKFGERSCNSSSSSSSGGPRPPLPGCLYGTAIAPFLHFGAPQRDQIYALGGRFEEQVLSTVEMFDTWRGKWVSQPPMAAKRCGCAAAALPDGGLLVVGGYDERGIVDGLLHSCEVFDPVIQQWAPCEHPLRRPRWGHACATLGGLVYTVGGCSLREGAPAHEAFMETLSSCEVLDPSGATGSGWRPAPSLCVARSGARVVALGSNYLAVVGGCDDVFGRSEVLSSVELFDISTQRWELLAPLLQVPRSTAAVAAIDDGRIMVVGGTPALASTEVYRVAQRAGGGGGGSGRGSPGGSSFVTGRPSEGLCGEDIGGSLPCPSMAEGRMGCHAVVLDLPAPGKTYPRCTEQCVVVIGGENSDEDFTGSLGPGPGRQLGAVVVFDVAKGLWRPPGSFPAMPTPRTAAALCLAPGWVAGFP
mmetsp:Transcript_63246/g.181403  ORF Transcript_63246/g.181403 Transcript_63246/m.181403 type:complete len:529 (-) Transcript_63246:132-1718(-)